jgi:DNA polymerase III psi subunit
MWGPRQMGNRGQSAFVRRARFESLEERVVMSASSVVAQDEVVAAAAALPAISEIDWIHSLTYTSFNLLSGEQSPLLTTQQVASIPDVYWFSQMSASTRGALVQSQVQALRVATVRINLLTPQQVGWLTTPQIQSLANYDDFRYLLPTQVPTLTTGQIAQISNEGTFWNWPAANRAALTGPQVQALRVSTVRINLLSPQQVGWLTTNQVRSIAHVNDFKFLLPSQIPSLTTTQVSWIPDEGTFWAWSSASRAALTASQIPWLRVGTVRINLLTPQQIGWLTPTQVQSLTNYSDFALLPASQVPSLTPAQVALVPDTGPFSTWSAASRAALTVPQVQALRVSNIRLTLLTATQVSWLTAGQIRSISTFDDFRLLTAWQVPSLTPAQIALIPDIGPFTTWSEASRAALTSLQVQAIRTATVRISWLTPQQISWLSTPQIQALSSYDDFRFLTSFQVPSLTSEQISWIPDEGAFWRWSAASRNALTSIQVQALQTAIVRINLLMPHQLTWLRPAQVKALTTIGDFALLPSSHVPFLTTTQIAQIPDAGWLSTWTAASRAALVQLQVQALQTSTIGISLLNAQQIEWLTVAQIRSLRNFSDFTLLHPNQVQYLLAPQIAMIPDAGALLQWPELNREALTFVQVQALRVATVRIALLSPTKVSWLLQSQIQSLVPDDFKYLNPWQVPLLKPSQFAGITSYHILPNLSYELQAALTRDQLLALPFDVLSKFTGIRDTQMPPTNYHPAVADTGSHSAAHDAEAERVLALAPLNAATHVTVASGSWNNPAVWRNGVIPAAGAKVVISAGTTVLFDARMAQAVKTLRIDGTLTFATNVSTLMKADTVIVTAVGKLHVGTAANPIANNVTAQIMIAESGAIDKAWDPYLLSRGILSLGQVVMQGKAVTPYVALLNAPAAGDTILHLAEAPTNWKVGDTLALSGTQGAIGGFGSEARRIRAINGTTVTIDPLAYDHFTPAGYGLTIYAANTSRNILIYAQDSSVVAERPHMMLMHTPDVSLANIGVYGFGRTDKSALINDPVVVNGVLQPGTGLNPRARYAIHFHVAGVNPTKAPARIAGSIVVGSPGWGIVNHSSNVDMDNNVVTGAVGSGFVTENGNEIGTMTRNLALNSYGSRDDVDNEARIALHDFGHAGHGFWLQGPGVSLLGNVSAGNRGAAYIYFTASSKVLFDAVNLEDPQMAGGRIAVPVSSVPLKQFHNNVAIASGSGLEIWHNQKLMTDSKSEITNFTAWGIRGVGIDLHYSGQISIINALLLGDLGRYTSIAGINANNSTNNIDYFHNRIAGFDIGLVAPSMRANLMYGGSIAAARSIVVYGKFDSTRTFDILGPIVYLPLTATQLGGRQSYKLYAGDYVEYTNRTLETLLGPDHIRIWSDNGSKSELVFFEQSPAYVPFKSDEAYGHVPYEYLDLTNQQLWDRYGIAYNGSLLPAGLPYVSGIYGFLKPIE